MSIHNNRIYYASGFSAFNLTLTCTVSKGHWRCLF